MSPENALDCNCFAVRAAARHVTQFYDRLLAPSGLRTTQFSILAKLARRGPLTISKLAADMVMDRTTLGRNILPLERDGLIRVASSAADRRARVLHRARDAQAQRGFETTFGAARAAELRTMLRAVAATDFAS
jgi:DNA-binding transcriptional ArsR family regulator